MIKRLRSVSSVVVVAIACMLQVVAVSGLAGEPQLAEKPLPREDKIKFKDGAGETALSLKFKGDGAKLTDGDDKELARYTRSDDKLKIKDDKDKVLGYIVNHDGALRLLSPEDESELFLVERAKNGDWTLKDAGGVRVAAFRRRDSGFVVEDAQDKVRHTVAVKSGKSTLRDASGKVLYQTKEEVTPSAVGCLALDVLPDVRIRGAFLFLLNQGEKK
ncbi:MAG: hypothetical protein NT069_14350 [Planctomycetota bacterium]|nr:hypothetical protein [Planctomycetota bacterium]